MQKLLYGLLENLKRELNINNDGTPCEVTYRPLFGFGWMRFKDSLPNQDKATRLFNQVQETFIELTALESGPLLLTTAQKAKLKIALPFVKEVISQPADVLPSAYQNNLECGILSLLCLIGVMVAPDCFPVIDIEPLCNEKTARRALVAFLMDMEDSPG
jgi:hypothetical protein